ncbi:AAC(3) family N-acetyltransferase [Streptomyces sp. SID13726]|uniref:aminoglycoside N(3)-acetyltransferase n=1 Tax=Streptomyces sp. SID13726 TaxID=2706058 RepID=UPI0031BBA278
MSAEQLRDELRAAGVREGSTLLVHSSLRRVGAGPDEVLAALRDVLGPDGTLVVPAFTAGNSDTSSIYRTRTRGMTARQRSAYRERMRPFRPDETPSEDMGRLAEAVRLSPGAVRSAHPQTSFAAVGARAADLLADHDEDCHLGPASPLARLYEVEARILLLGVGYAACSAFHLAEYLVSETPPTREYRCVVLRDGERCWISYKDVDLDDRDFADLGRDFEACDTRRAEPLVRGGRLGGAGVRLVPMRAAVDFASQWLAGNRPYGVSTNQSQIAAGFLH